MTRGFLAAVLCASAVALAQGAPAPKPAREEPPAPDVSRLPFTPDSIRQVMGHHKGKLQACYEEVMAAQEKKVEGRLMTAFTITPEGTVKDARVLKKGTTLQAPGLHECVVAALTSLTFPKPADGRDHPIEFPFNLKAVE
jgi:hypothetical protein